MSSSISLPVRVRTLLVRVSGLCEGKRREDVQSRSERKGWIRERAYLMSIVAVGFGVKVSRW